MKKLYLKIFKCWLKDLRYISKWRFLLTEYRQSRGLWCVDRKPNRNNIQWVIDCCYQLENEL